MLELRLLGDLEITVDGSPLEVDTRKAVALLAYLVVSGAALRETLTTLLWADAPPDRARATLRRTLSSLRSGTGPDHIESDRNRVAVVGPLSSDVVEFDSAIESTQLHGHDAGDVCDLCVPPLQRAADLYRGDFLQGFSVRDAFLFEDWVRATSESLRLKAGEVFNRLGYALAGAGDYPGAIREVSRWIELDPLHEPAHRLLMLLHAWAGDRPGSVDAYRSFVGILDRELGVPPLDETTELYEAILDEDLPPAPGARHRVKAQRHSQPIDRGEMIGRGWELGRLMDLALSNDKGSLVAVVGDSWMGKTRLLEELAGRLPRDRVDIAVSRAFRLERALPFAVLEQVLDQLIESGHDLGAAPDWAVAEVGRILPRLAAARPAPSGSFGELRLFEAIHAILSTIGRRLVIIVDDLQWADQASISFLGYLARRLEDLPILVVVALRAGFGGDAGADEIARGAEETLTLQPLTAGDLDLDEQAMIGASELIEATGGVPFLIVETLDGRTEGDTPGVVRYMGSRLREVSNLARQLLTAAAVLRGVNDSGLLREVSGRTEDEVVAGVEELLSAGLLAEVPNSDGLRFALDALESIVYESTSLIRRRLLHRRAAEALTRLPWSESDPRLAGAIAAQHEGAGSPRAVAWYRRAGELSRGVFAHREARAFYEAAIALGSDPGGELHLALGEVEMAQANYEMAKNELRVAAAHAEGPALAVVEHRLGEVHRVMGRFDLALESFDTALVEHPAPSEVLADRALLHNRLGDRNAALADATESLRLARADGDNGHLSRSLNVLAVIEGDRVASIRYLDEALVLAGEDPVARLSALNNKAELLASSADPEQAIPLLEEAIELARRSGHRHREAALHNHLADVHHRQGREDEAKRALTHAVELFADVDAGKLEPEIWLLRQW